MSAEPEIQTARGYLRLVSETTDGYDAQEPTAAEAAGGARHVRIPYAVFSCPGMSHGAILLYGWLQHHNGPRGCFPSQAMLAEELGGGERSVRRYLDELEAAGFIRCDARKGIGVGGSLPMSYRLFPNGDAEPNRPKRTSEPAILAASEAEPAKNDMYIKVEPEPENHTQRTSHAYTAREGWTPDQVKGQIPLVGPDPKVAAVLDALQLTGAASIRAITAILKEFPGVVHESAAACCAAHFENLGKRITASNYRNWCFKELTQNGASHANGTEPDSAANERTRADRPDPGLRGAAGGTASPPSESANARGWREHQQRVKDANRHILDGMVPVVSPSDAR